MKAQRAFPWRHALALGSAVGALILLTMFYSVVSAAVERGASRRAELNAAGSTQGAVATGRSLERAGSASRLVLAGASR